MRTDLFCQKNADPALYEDQLDAAGNVTSEGVINKENSEAAEQTFRWMGLFGNIVRTMGQVCACMSSNLPLSSLAISS